MKRIFSLLFFGISLLLFMGSCAATDTYEKQLEAEKTLISDFIKRNNINVISQVPSNNVWGENDYLKTDDGFYIHIVDTGEINTDVKVGQLVLARYYRMTLNDPGEIDLNKWTTSDSPYPEEITYMVSNTATCPAFHEAIKYMKRHNSEAKFIVPSKLGLEAQKDAVTPYFYHFKIKLTE